MEFTKALGCLGFFALSVLAAEPGGPEGTTGTVLQQMTDLEGLARWPVPAYRTIQFSSYDRRSTTSEAPGWFSNADGFGGEPIPAFLKVLRPPSGDGPGLYLLADVEGPGVIVRGWSAGMDGVLKVWLDPVGPTAPRKESRFGREPGTISWPGVRAAT
jgi:hypothetical protein